MKYGELDMPDKPDKKPLEPGILIQGQDRIPRSWTKATPPSPGHDHTKLPPAPKEQTTQCQADPNCKVPANVAHTHSLTTVSRRGL